MPELDSPTDLDPSFRSFDADDDRETDSPARGFREGLPKTYRSRHDPHYVEQLTRGSDTEPVRLIPLARIETTGLPPEHTVAGLAESISELGVLQPLLVRPHEGRFHIIAGRRRLAAARRAGLTEVPCLVHSVSDARAAQLAEADNLRGLQGYPSASLAAPSPDVAAPVDAQTFAMMSELQDAVASLQSCLPLIARTASTRERVALKLLTVEAERAAWAINARRYLAATAPIAHTPLGGAALLDQIKRQAGDTIALRGGVLQVDSVRGALMLHGDRILLATAAAGIVQALFALGELVQDPRVVVRLAAATGGGSVALTFAQPSAVLGGAALDSFFEAGWAERPGGASAELAVLLARHTATVHGARLEASSAPGAGTIVTMIFGAHG